MTGIEIPYRCASKTGMTDNIEDLTTTALGLFRRVGGKKTYSSLK